ncbi:diaminobutyrate acetyltransferase [Paenibacillus sp. TRM 82003]|nr:diaminobutyrate acetyltransferase [Paenibacillus sp. TRM 82003]
MAPNAKDVVTLEKEERMMEEELFIRKPCDRDGAGIWNVVRDSGKLDVNSAYCYLMLGKYFYNTCAVAELGKKTVGFVSGFRHPDKPDTWFVWQIAVDAEARGKGLARKLLEHVLSRPENQDIRFIETNISPSNAASQSLFLGFARDRGVTCQITEGFTPEMFPAEGSHEEELLFQIGPFQIKP